MQTLSDIKALFRKHAFRHDIRKPIIVVLPNTDKNGKDVADTGMNNCDTVLLVDAGRVVTLTGRSYAVTTHCETGQITRFRERTAFQPERPAWPA